MHILMGTDMNIIIIHPIKVVILSNYYVMVHQLQLIYV